MDHEKLFKEKFHIKYLKTLRFENKEAFHKVLEACPWLFKSSLFGDSLRELAEKYQDEISKGYFTDVTIDWINETLGFGLFTNKDLKKGDYIGEYLGDVRRLYRFHPETNYYCLAYPQAPWAIRLYVIDSKEAGNESRFINHSFTPNLDMKIANENNLMHILLFANQDIPKGTQLTLNYGKDFWRGKPTPINI